MSFHHISKLSDRIFFGKYICPQTLEELNSVGVNLVIDCTTEVEKSRFGPSAGSLATVSFPIEDQGIASDESVKAIVAYICTKLTEGSTVYIHCRGGHGRSAVLAGIVYGTFENVYSSDAVLKKISEAHKARLTMNSKWRLLGAPQNKSQKDQVRRLLMASDLIVL